ncbi:MAG: hypothetical protein KBT36_11810 [Kurthia sp.]|nr:hypothetical protein [Candidatus Kurthia equi]
MPNPVSKIFAIILATLVMFMVPAYQNAKKQEDLTYLNTYKVVTNFTDSVRLKGYITPDMYNEFALSLHTGTNVLFDIKMEHKKKVYNPVYTDPNDLTTFTGDYQVDYESYVETQINEVLFDSNVPYENRMYKLQKDDEFSVTVTNKTKFKSTMILDFLTANIAGNDEVIYFPYGGIVLNEDWNERR